MTAAFLALLLISYVAQGRRPKPHRGSLVPEPELVILLFDGHELVDATAPARSLLERIPGSADEWARLSSYLSQRIVRFEERLEELPSRGRVDFAGKDGVTLNVVAEAVGGMMRLTLTDPEAEGQGIVVDALSLRAQEEELKFLRLMHGALPSLLWRTDEDGTVTWANKAYLDLSAESGESELMWPLPVQFPQVGAQNAAGPARRLKRAGSDRAKGIWYEVASFPLGDATMHHAVSVDALVKAETALREFIQTLTKTFAHLPIGLAIFDRQRQLALFNPALTDLTTLGVEFLSGRPTLFAFLDQLREARVIPEPKDYQSWRLQMSELERAAASGHYEETWALSSGQTYKVTGRPHPDGAVALLIEDISAEITLTRHFRSEIELGQSVVDAIDEAICVFSPAGEIILSNAAYAALWSVDPGTTLGRMSIRDAIRHWQGRTLPTPVWGDARDFVSDIGERAEWFAEVSFVDGGVLNCRFAPLPGGATLAAFSKGMHARPPLRRLRRGRRTESELMA
ncbi:MAG: PAS-domain containing protein [Paracoccaceae bacterium]